MLKCIGLILALSMVALGQAAPRSTLLRVPSVPEAKITHKVQPAYPADALDLRIQGVVRVSVVVGKDGHVEQARLSSGDPLLAPAALQAARGWTFEPFQNDGGPVRA